MIPPADDADALRGGAALPARPAGGAGADGARGPADGGHAATRGREVARAARGLLSDASAMREPALRRHHDQAAGARRATSCSRCSARRSTAALDASWSCAPGSGWLAWLIDVAFASALVLVTVGCFAPQRAALRAGHRRRRASHERVVAITFDDGPSPDTTPRVLDALRDAGARATFFVLGKHAEQHPEIVERMVREGHEVATHGYSHGHPRLRRPRARSRASCCARTASCGGRAPGRRALFRAARTASATRSSCRVARRLGYRVVRLDEGRLRHRAARRRRDRRALAKALGARRDPAAPRRRRQRRRRPHADRRRRCRRSSTPSRERRAPRRSRCRSWPRSRRSARRRGSGSRSSSSPSRAIVTVGFERLDRQQIIDAWDDVAQRCRVPLVIAGAARELRVRAGSRPSVWKASLDTIPRPPAVPLPAGRPGDLRRLPAERGAGRAARRGRPHGRAAPARAEGRGHRRCRCRPSPARS